MECFQTSSTLIAAIVGFVVVSAVTIVTAVVVNVETAPWRPLFFPYQNDFFFGFVQTKF